MMLYPDSPRIIMVTTSNDKVFCVRDILKEYGWFLEVESLPLQEIQALDPKIVVHSKLVAAVNAIKSDAVMVDDAGLNVEYLGNFPGALIGTILKSGGLKLLHRIIHHNGDGRIYSATMICAVGLHINGIDYIGTGSLDGVLDFRNGYPTDSKKLDDVFVPKNVDRCLSELRLTEPLVSVYLHRTKALRAVMESFFRNKPNKNCYVNPQMTENNRPNNYKSFSGSEGD
jgi:inosine/xanthosine triphosphate pyrophosphatase family protein